MKREKKIWNESESSKQNISVKKYDKTLCWYLIKEIYVAGKKSHSDVYLKSFYHLEYKTLLKYDYNSLADTWIQNLGSRYEIHNSWKIWKSSQSSFPVDIIS